MSALTMPSYNEMLKWIYVNTIKLYTVLGKSNAEYYENLQHVTPVKIYGGLKYNFDLVNKRKKLYKNEIVSKIRMDLTKK